MIPEPFEEETLASLSVRVRYLVAYVQVLEERLHLLDKMSIYRTATTIGESLTFSEAGAKTREARTSVPL